MMYNGHTWELTDQERATNEVNACIDTVEVCPDNEYWQTRLANAIVEEYYIYNQGSVSEPETIAEAESAMLIGAPCLNDMTDAEQKKWYADIQPIEF